MKLHSGDMLFWRAQPGYVKLEKEKETASFPSRRGDGNSGPMNGKMGNKNREGEVRSHNHNGNNRKPYNYPWNPTVGNNASLSRRPTKTNGVFGRGRDDVSNIFATTTAAAGAAGPRKSINNVKNSGFGEKKFTGENALKNVYVPPAPLHGKALLNDRRAKFHGAGMNFSDYDKTPVEVSGKNLLRLNVNSFADLGLDSVILENISQVGYKVPTPIQKNAAPYIAGGRDIMACAQTGSGKTAGYLLPIINALKHESPIRQPAQCLILAPTRELALQIQTEANLYSNKTGLKSCCICGGIAFFHQKGLLRGGCNIIVATPGRLLQFLEEGSLNLMNVKYFVLDEADRMLDLRFMGVVEAITRFLPPKGNRTSAMFSATFPGGVQRAAEKFLTDHVFISVGTVGAACQDVLQQVIRVSRGDRTSQLLDILNDSDLNQKTVIFCAKKTSTNLLSTILLNLGFRTTFLNSNMAQSERERTVEGFSTGRFLILVTTGIASRGLDIPKVSLVINYDLPECIDEYVQRIGRTGRIGHVGKAISFFEDIVDDPLRPKLVHILRTARQAVPQWLLEERDEKFLEDKYTYGSRFTSTNFRRKLNLSSHSHVPEAVDLDEYGLENPSAMF